MGIRKLSLSAIIMIFFLGSFAHAWTITADFEGGNVGQVVSGDIDDAFSQSTYSNARAVSGTMSMDTLFNAGNEGWGEYGGVVNFPSSIGQGGEVWARMYMWHPSGFSHESSHVKILRFRMTGGGYHSIIGRGDLEMCISNEITDVLPCSSSDWRVGVWEATELYVKASSGSDGRVRMWLNGELAYELQGPTLGGSIDALYVFTYWNNGPSRNYHIWVDDLVVTNQRPNNQDAQGNYLIGGSNFVPSPEPPPSLVPEKPGNIQISD